MGENGIYILVGTAVVALLPQLVMMVVKSRQEKADREEAGRQAESRREYETFKSRTEEKIERLETEIQTARIAQEGKISRQELTDLTTRLFASVDNLRAEFKSEMGSVTKTILAAMGKSTTGL